MHFRWFTTHLISKVSNITSNRSATDIGSTFKCVVTNYICYIRNLPTFYTILPIFIMHWIVDTLTKQIVHIFSYSTRSSSNSSVYTSQNSDNIICISLHYATMRHHISSIEYFPDSALIQISITFNSKRILPQILALT